MDSDRNYLIVQNNKMRIDFNKQDGFLNRFEIDGKAMMQKDAELKPNFWRAPTDNDFGADLENEYAAWKQPEYKLTDLKNITSNGGITVIANYDMPSVSSKLVLTYNITNDGKIKVTQELITDKTSKVSNMFRFGMQLQMPEDDDYIQYYGKGPFENYIDQKQFFFYWVV